MLLNLYEKKVISTVLHAHLGNVAGKNDPDRLYSVIAPYYEQI